MSSHPLDEPHLEALRSVCVLAIAAGNPPGFLEGLAERADEPAKSAAHTLSRSDLSASLVRDLLARAGVDVGPYDDDCAHVNVDLNVEASDKPHGGFGPPAVTIWIHGEKQVAPEVHRLILALCDLATGDKEGAMRALGEVGR